MKCSEFEPCLDGFLDDTLSSAQLSEMEAHAEICPHCAEQLRITRQMKSLFGEMLPEVDVPLEVQAGWRRAVRAERRGRFHWIRYAASAAAVLIAVFGLSLVVGHRPSAMVINAEIARETDAWLIDAGKSSVFEADGMVAAEAPALSSAGPMREISMTVEDLDAAIAHIADLAVEYEGSVDTQRFESDGVPCANLYINLPTDNLPDFLSAAAYLDASGSMEGETVAGSEGETALLLVLRTT